MKKLDHTDWRTEDAVTLFRAWMKEEGSSMLPCDSILDALSLTNQEAEEYAKFSVAMQVKEILNKDEFSQE